MMVNIRKEWRVGEISNIGLSSSFFKIIHFLPSLSLLPRSLEYELVRSFCDWVGGLRLGVQKADVVSALVEVQFSSPVTELSHKKPAIIEYCWYDIPNWLDGAWDFLRGKVLCEKESKAWPPIPRLLLLSVFEFEDEVMLVVPLKWLLQGKEGRAMLSTTTEQFSRQEASGCFLCPGLLFDLSSFFSYF